MLCRLKTGFVVLMLGAVVYLPNAFAKDLPEPEGPVILTVSGKIAHVTDGKIAEFDRQLLEELGTSTIRTTTPWHDGITTFEGVSAQRLMDHVGADGNVVVATALNQYQAEIPLSDFRDKGVLLALKAEGEYLSIRDKGPIFIIYPFDQDETLRNEMHYARSVWQVKAFEIK